MKEKEIEREKANHSLVDNWKWGAYRLQDKLWEQEIDQILNIQLVSWGGYYMSNLLVGYISWLYDIAYHKARYMLYY